MSTSSAPLVPGYSLGERLGAGGSATVWAGTRDVDGAAVAVKVVACGTDPAAAARELAVLGQVRVDGVLRLHEAVALVGEPPAVALVVDRAEGGSLERALRGRGHLTVGESVTVLAPVARALAGLHAAGVVHGDVSPANVLLERSGRPLLADLGVARLVAESVGASVAGAGEVEVTPELAAPEVLTSGAVTPASDVYAAGALAWWCVTGVPPALPALRPELADVAGWLPKAWRDATLAALSADPSERPSAAALALAWFDSAPCEPLHLVSGRDETSLLTQRLRHGAPPAEEQPPPPRAPWWRRVVPARWAREPRQHRPQRPRQERLRQPRQGRRRRLTALLALGVGAVSLAVPASVVGVDLARSGQDEGVAPTTTRSTTPSSAPPTDSLAAGAGAARATGGPLTTRRAPTHDPRGLMQALADLRSRAVVSRSTADLDLLDAPSSPALATDTAVLAELDRSGSRWAGVRLTVRRAVLTGGSTDRAVVEAVVDTAAHTVVEAAGSERAVPAVRGQPMRFDLRWVAGRWRVHTVAAAAPGASWPARG